MFDVVGNVNEKILGREADLAPVSSVLHITPETTEYLLRIVDADDASRVIEDGVVATGYDAAGALSLDDRSLAPLGLRRFRLESGGPAQHRPDRRGCRRLHDA